VEVDGMRHFSCDLCGRDLTANESRFVLRMEVYAATARGHESASSLDDDAAEMMGDLLDALDGDSETDLELSLAPSTQSMEYDLCPNCRTRFAADPLGRDQLRKLRFSAN